MWKTEKTQFIKIKHTKITQLVAGWSINKLLCTLSLSLALSLSLSHSLSLWFAVSFALSLCVFVCGLFYEFFVLISFS